VNTWLRRTGAIILLLAVFSQLAVVNSVSGQSTPRARINLLDASGFPTVRLEADVNQADGSFVSDLKPSDFKILENGIQRPVDEVRETPNAVDFVVAVNGGSILGNRISSKTNLQLIKDALLEWIPEAKNIGKGDSVTLVTNAGVKAVRLNKPEEWTAVFNSISPELVNATPSLTSLSKAVEQATSAPTRPGMKQTILYITPLMSSSQSKAIDNVAEQAAGAGVVINIWLVAPTSAKQPVAEQAIQSLADRTGGQLYRFSGKEALPPVETYLQPLRRQYEVIYRSRSSQSGIQIVILEVHTDTVQARSPEENFDITLKAPNVMFISPVEKVDLSWIVSDGGRSVLNPPEVSFELFIEFPDNHPRNLTVSRLLVNGEVVDERNSPPFTKLSWPVTGMKSSGTYNVQVTIKDELDFSGKTVVLPLDVIVPPPPAANMIESVSSERLALAVGAVLLVVAGGFFTYFRMKKAREKSRLKPAATRIDSHPLERPGAVINLSDNTTKPSLSATPRDTSGWLLPMADGDTLSTQPNIRLGESVITLGSSPIRSQVVIASPSVDGLHVRITHRQDGTYWLEDAGSVSGTWVNGTPVSNLGTALTAGDVIRLGKVSFRFELRG
jgi:hypothetical protein